MRFAWDTNRKGIIVVMLKKYLWKYKFMYLIGIAILFIVDILGVYIPQITGELIEGLGKGGFGKAEVGHCVLMLFLTGLGMTLGRFGWRYFLFGSARKIEHGMRVELFNHLSKLSVRYYNENKTGDLMAYFTNDISAIRVAIGPAVISSFDAIVMTIMVVAKMIWYVDIRLTLLSCIPMLFILIGAIWYCKMAVKLYTEKNEAFSALSDKVQESISGIRVIKAFVQEKQDIREFAKANKNNMEKNLRIAKVQTVMIPLLDFLIGVSSVINLLYGGRLLINGEISLGQFVAFNSYIGMLVWPMIAAGDSINSFSQGRAAVNRLNKIFKEVPDIKDTGKDSNITSLHGDIEVKDLDFEYIPGTDKVLEGVSFKIPKGSTLAIIGRTGSGKTTIANLLLRMYETKPGSIRYDGHNIEDIPLEVLHKQIAYVPQDNFLFSDTVQANIAFGVRDNIEIEAEKFSIKTIGKGINELSSLLEDGELERYEKVDKAYGDLQEVEEAAKLACVHDNIIDFPQKYGTLVGERGVTMSGGQKQRSSIARALMKNAPVLILDDALSAVDTDTEEKILENLKADREDKTTIIIAHRISTIQNADKILVLDEGKMAEYGSHEELLKLGGRYAKLYEKQQLEKMLEKCE